jgi:hypothetical protein
MSLFVKSLLLGGLIALRLGSIGLAQTRPAASATKTTAKTATAPPVRSATVTATTATTNPASTTGKDGVSAVVNGKPFKAPGRRVRFGNYTYLTANLVNPDRTVQLRIWQIMAESQLPAPGEYEVISSNEVERAKQKEMEARMMTAQSRGMKGFALIDYSEETKGMGFAYHVGESQPGGKFVLTVSNADRMEGTFSGKLKGVFYKERTSATVFGGMSRIMNKLEDKAVKAATGWEGDISNGPGGGYRKQPETDEITLTDGVISIAVNASSKTEKAKE